MRVTKSTRTLIRNAFLLALGIAAVVNLFYLANTRLDANRTSGSRKLVSNGQASAYANLQHGDLDAAGQSIDTPLDAKAAKEVLARMTDVALQHPLETFFLCSDMLPECPQL